jgi:hypothetical protein
MDITRIGRTLAVLGVLAGLAAGPARAASFAILDSDDGDPVGAAGHYQLGSPEGAFVEVSSFSPQYFDLRFATATDSWDFFFASYATPGLTPGLYQVNPLQGGPRLSIRHGQAECATPQGQFQIHSIAFAPDQSLLSVDLSFVQRCQDGGPRLRGVLLYRAGDATCANAPDGTACDDTNACTVGDTCHGGSCLSGPHVSCDDHNDGTDDVCFIDQGCSNRPASSTWALDGQVDVEASANGRTVHRRATSSGTAILRIDHTYEIPSGTCPDTGATLLSELGRWHADRRGRIHLVHSNIQRVVRTVARCLRGPALTVSSYRHWMDIRTTGGTFCAWHPVPADGRHLCGLIRLQGTATVSGITVTQSTVVHYAATRTDRGRFLPATAPPAGREEAPGDGHPLAAALPVTSP